MFAIYGINGPIYQGTLEGLSRLPPVVRRRPIGGARPVGVGEDPPSGFVPPEPPSESTQPPPAAVSAYRAMLPEALDRGPLYQANQIMQSDVITLQMDDSVSDAWHTLVRHQIHQAPVLDGMHRLVGVVSERHLLTTLNLEDGKIRDALARRVSDVMATPVVAAAPKTDLRRIAQVMLERDVDGVPITSERGTLIGFISRSDILRAVITDPPLSIWR